MLCKVSLALKAIFAQIERKVNHMEDSKREKLWEYLMPLFGQFIILAVFMIVHNWVSDLGSPVTARTRIAGDMTNPSMGRLIYMVVSLMLFAVTSVYANRFSFKEGRRNVFISFWLGIVSGTFLWQAIGEDAWNFGVQTSDGLLNFSRLENISAMFLLISFLYFVYYLVQINALSFGVTMVITSFLINWVGHYVMEASYPFVKSIFTESKWYMTIGSSLGIIILVGCLYYLFKRADSLKKRLYCSAVSYFAVGMIYFGFMK